MKLSQLLSKKSNKGLSKTPKIQHQKRPYTSYNPQDLRPTSSRINLSQKFNPPLPPIAKKRRSQSRLYQHVLAQKKHINTNPDVAITTTTAHSGKFIKHASGGADKLRIPIPPQRKNSTQASQQFWDKASNQFQNAEMYKNLFLQQQREEYSQDQYFREAGIHPSAQNQQSHFTMQGESGMQQKEYIPSNKTSIASFAQRYHERKRSQGMNAMDLSLKQSKNNFQTNDKMSSISNINNRSQQVASNNNNNDEPIETRQSHYIQPQNQIDVGAWGSRPFHFLSSVGGRQTSSQAVITPHHIGSSSSSVSNQVTPRYQRVNSNAQKDSQMYFNPSSKTVTTYIRQKNDNVRQLTIFTGANVDKKTQFDRTKSKEGSMSSRPPTTKGRVINSKTNRQQQQQQYYQKHFNSNKKFTRPSSAQSSNFKKIMGPSGSSVQMDVLRQNMRRIKQQLQPEAMNVQIPQHFIGDQDFQARINQFPQDFEEDVYFQQIGLNQDDGGYNFPPQQRPPNIDIPRFGIKRPKSASSHYQFKGKPRQAKFRQTEVAQQQVEQSKTAGSVKIPQFLHLIENIDLNSTANNAISQTSLPYPQLLDRSERTLAATFAKFKDLTYYTPVQRIGAYYDFTSRLKRKHLLDIITFLKTAQATGAYREQSTPQQFTQNSLFLGIMQLQNFSQSKNSKANNLLGQQIQRQNQQTVASAELEQYDPANVGYWDKKPDFSKVWSSPLIKRLEVSIIRYLQYLHSDSIEEVEISKYKKEWMTNALNQVPDSLLSRQYLRELFSEIFKDYSLSQRTAILNYVLLSPYERQRLHILVLPLEFSLTSCQRISRYGGYNLIKYKEWHRRKIDAESNIKIKLLTNNIAMSSLTQWFHQFRDFRLLQLHGTRKYARIGGSYSLSVYDFINLQLAYREKVISFMRDIWLRGAVLITKRFKFLKKKGFRNGKWDFNGYKQLSLNDYEVERSFEKRCNQLKLSVIDKNSQSCMNNRQFQHQLSSALEHSQISLIQMQNQNNQVLSSDSMMLKEQQKLHAKLGFQDHLIDYYESILDPNELQDIRQNSAYISFVAMIGGYIDFNQDGYNILAKEYKRQIVYCAGNLMRLQLRQIVDKSLDIVKQFFLSFSTLSDLMKNNPHLNKPTYSHSYGAISYCDDIIEENEKQKDKEDIQSKPIIYGGAPILGVHDQDSKSFQQIERQEQFAREQKRYVHLEFPPFFNYQHLVNPIFRLDLVVLTDTNHPVIEFQKSMQQISKIFEKWINDMIVSFNQVPRIEFCQLEFISREQMNEEIEEERKQEKLFGKVKKFNNDFDQVVFKQGDPRINSRFFGTCRVVQKQLQPNEEGYSSLKEKKKKSNTRKSITKFTSIQAATASKRNTSPFNKSSSFIPPSQSRNQIKRYQRVARIQEKRYLKIKEIALETLNVHYNQSTAVFEFFQQFREIFSGQLQSEYDSLLMELSLEDNLKHLSTPIKKVKYKLYKNAKILGKCRRYADMVQLIPNNFFFPLFEINCVQVKNKLTQMVRGLISTLLVHLQTEMNQEAKGIGQKFQDLINVLKKQTTNAFEVMEMQKFKGRLIQTSIILNDEIQLNRMTLFFLLHDDHILTEEALQLATKLYHWPSILSEVSTESDERHRSQRTLVERDLRQRRVQFQEDVKEMRIQVKDIEGVCEITHYRKWIQKVTEWQEKLQKLEEIANLIGEEENMLFSFKSTIDAFEDLQSFYDPYAELWLNINEFLTKKKEWTTSLLHTIDPQEVNEQIKLKIRILAKLSKLFNPRKDVSATRVLSQFKTEVTDLNNQLPKIEILCNDNLRERHWRKMQHLIGANFNWRNITLTQVSYLKFDSKLQQLADISDEASKQLSIEKILDKMEKEWEDLHFVVTTFRDSGIPILHGSSVEEIQLLLDDHLLKAQNMRGSLYIKPFEDRVIAWDKSLLHINQMIENWVEVQAQYLYLEPIFNSQDMKRQMPGEATQFSRIDDMWRDIMSAMMNDTLVLHVERIPNANQRLRRANVSLQHIQRSLNDYLESKRAVFARFYFLSNDELLQILGERRKPEKIQRYLKKCFEGINELKFSQIQGQNGDITHMISREGETIQLIHSIDPHMYDGNVQQWLLQLEHEMRASMKQVCQQCNLDIRNSQHLQGKKMVKRYQWLTKWPAQAILAISSVQRTRDIEKALSFGENQQRKQKGSFDQEEQIKTSRKGFIQQIRGSLEQSLNNCKNNIQGIVKLVRSARISQNLRIILGAMIVQDVHSRDVIQLLIEKQVKSLTDFEWTSQLRYYYDHSVEKLYIKMVNTSLVYGYEYIGNTSRLVITPLTDRCYRTLMSAIDLNLGGAPQGPAGTGKTESTKDLAKTVGVCCIIFNCSQGLNADVMAKFFKGLAASGSWSCFDQFNRIEIEVLSVIAQQILELQTAKSKRMSRFNFQGKEIDLNPSCNVFITMNPGYAGRTQLPDNLKALFRPVAMMVPDYSLIAEISLYSFGFNEARDLARKVVMTFNLCSDQLSRQDHYDYGMRAVKAVLTTAAKLKQKVAKKGIHSVKQQNIILKAIKDANLPRFLPKDAILFEGILKDLFINTKPHDDTNSALQKCIHRQIMKANLQIVDPFVEKCMQLHQTIKYRHGLMIVGASFGGKTQSYRVLNAAINQYVREFKPYFKKQGQESVMEDEYDFVEQNDDKSQRSLSNRTETAQQFSSRINTSSYEPEIPVMNYVINPKAVSVNELYGSYDSISHDWTDGILVHVFRQCAYKDVGRYQKWLIFDGPVDTQWIQNMNTVLDDTKKLCLSNGQTILMHNYMNLIFEVDDLSQASPATISRCGMVCMQPEFIGWFPIYQSWIEKLPHSLNREIIAPRIEEQLHVFCPELIKFVKKKSSKPESISQIQLVVSLLKIYGAQLRHKSFSVLFAEQRIKQDVVHMHMDLYFLYSCLWSFGVTLDNAKDQNQMFAKIRQLSTEQHKIYGTDKKSPPKKFHIERTAIFPDSSRFTGYDYYIDGTHWRPWSDMLQKMDSILKMRQDSQSEMDFESIPRTLKHSNSKSRVGKLSNIPVSSTNSAGVGTQPYLPIPALSTTSGGSNIIVHTTQSLKYSSFINLLLQNGQSPLIIGQSGIGKTSIIIKYLESLNNNTYTKNMISFSSATNSSTTQSQIHSKLQRRSRKQYGPSFGKKLLLFVDDVNLPNPDNYGFQPPIQLLRQIIDHGGWYQLEQANKPFKQLVDLLFLSSMGLAGRSQVSQRYLRHFNIACIPQCNVNNLTRIFTKQFQVYFYVNKITDSDIKRMFQNCIAASIEVYFRVCKEFKPTPQKFLYMFNSRDLVRAVQGIQLYVPTVPNVSNLNEGEMSSKSSVQSTRKIVRLWAHQMMRVFYDRLIGQKDKNWMIKQIFAVCRDKIRDDLIVALKQQLDAVDVADKSDHDLLKNLKFCDFIQVKKGGVGKSSFGAKQSWKLYQEILVKEQVLEDKISGFLQEYNSVSKNPMNLVLFDFAVQHLIRITRILRMNNGHGLLVGIGGSGKESLTRLASYIQQTQLFQIRTKGINYSVDDWRDDMTAVLKESGVTGKKILLYLRQANIEGHPSNDINQLLNIGEIPGILGNQQVYSITEQLRILAKKEGRIDLYNSNGSEQLMDYFKSRCKSNLHVILAFSPIGNGMRNIIRSYPSLLFCCTIDWLDKWPDSALKAVSMHFLTAQNSNSSFLQNQQQQEQQDILESTSHCKAISSVANKMQNIAIELSANLRKVQKRFNYITPSTFLDLLLTFKQLISMRKKQLIEQKLGYDKGIEKLIFTAEQVTKMQQDLSEKQPKLHQMAKQTEELMQKVQFEAEQVVQPQRKIIAEEEEKTNERFLQADSIKNQCREELAVAKPMVDAAIAALNTIKPQDILELRSLLKPPIVIRKVLHAVCIMCQVEPIKTPKPDHPKELEVNWWETARKLMAQKDFLASVIQFDKDHIPQTVMENIRSNFLPDPDFKPSRAKQASMAAKGLCQWIRALDKYDIVAKQVAPKRQKAKQSQRAAKEAKRILKLKQDQLRQVVEKLNELQQQLEFSARKRKTLELDIQNCKLKISRACTLLDSLGGERIRWTQISQDIQKSLDTLLGDTLLCSSFIVYLGAFPSNYREEAVQTWKDYIQQEQGQYLPINRKFNFTSCIGSMIQAREWQLNSLPTDQLSQQNALIIKHSRKWSLLIDPQSQGNKWIKRQHQSFHRFSVVRLTDRDKLRTFENCIQFGIPILLQNVPEQIDSVLEPILAKQIFKNAGVQSIKLGENIIEYSSDFKLFITTKMQNPHFLPRLSAKITLINFSITEHGLRDQILDLIIQREKPKLQDEKNHLIIQSYEFNKQLRDVEQRILQILRTTGANILENEKAIQILQESQSISYETKNKQQAAIITKRQIDQARSWYEPASGYASMLYFTIRMISKVDVMYQFSLPWYLNILQSALEKSKRSDEVEERVSYIEKQLLSLTFENIMRSMFEKDKLLFSFLLTVKSQLYYSQIEKWTFNLLAQRWNMIEISENKESKSMKQYNPCNKWLNNQKWLRLIYLETNCRYKSSNPISRLLQNFALNSQKWEVIYEEGIVKENKEILFQDKWPMLKNRQDDINRMERLLIIKAIAPNKLKSAIRVYIEKFMGRQFIQPPTFDLDASFDGSAYNIPLIFVLPGNEPLGPLNSFAKIKKKFDNLKKISLGQGTGPRAQKAIEDAKKNGQWVLLQNCHLAPSWMPNLEKIVETFQGKPPNRAGSTATQGRPSPEKGASRKYDSVSSTMSQIASKQSQIHPSFRLWLTTYSSEHFPQLVLQNGIKIINEPPIGLKANLISSYTLTESINDPVKFQLHPYPLFWKRLLFSLCSFHALIQQRTKYGSLGWNEVYKFTHSDLQISILQLYKQLQGMPQLQFEYIPWKALHYLTGQCNYGGRITDEHDRKLLNSLLHDMYSTNSLKLDAKIRGLRQFPFPGDEMGYIKTMDFICNEFPIIQPAQLFGFNSNADIVKDINLGKEICDTLFSLREDVNSSSLLSKLKQSKDQEDEQQAQKIINRQLQGNTGLNVVKQQESQDRNSSTRRIYRQAVITQEDDNDEQKEISVNDATLNIIQDIQSKLQNCKFDLQSLASTHPIQYEDSINTILYHQVERYNSLIKAIQDSLIKVKQVILGQIQMKNELQEIQNQLKSNKTPRAWLKRSYPSIKPLGSYISDLKKRLEMFKSWINNGKPGIYWFSGFFFPHSFLTALLQGYSRSRQCPIDELEFNFDFKASDNQISDGNDMYVKSNNKDGMQKETEIYGLFLEGAAWNGMFRQMEEAGAGVLYVKMPIIVISVCRKKKLLKSGSRIDYDDDKIMPMSYDCPVYLTQERRNKISIYSYSQNHVINMIVPAAKPGDHWLKRGVALVCQIAD